MEHFRKYFLRTAAVGVVREEKRKLKIFPTKWLAWADEKNAGNGHQGWIAKPKRGQAKRNEISNVVLACFWIYLERG
jgi:hypothetical protein